MGNRKRRKLRRYLRLDGSGINKLTDKQAVALFVWDLPHVNEHKARLVIKPKPCSELFFKAFSEK